MIGFDEAIGRLPGREARLGTESVALADAHGRVLAAPVHAQIAAPRTAVSSMDGYAVREADLAALPALLPILGESFPGTGFAGAVERGRCVRIFTGAPVPAGADRIVVQEVVTGIGDTARIDGPVDTARYIRGEGSDFRLGELVVEAGVKLTPQALVAVGAADVARVVVARRPHVLILCTGDELVAPGQAAGQPSAVPDSISASVAALVRDWGGEPVGVQRLGDDLPALQAAASAATAAAELVVVTGGASVGERDFARSMFAPAGLDLVFAKVAMKPGKPVWFGRAGGARIIGLPGNPSSALVTARLFVAPLLCALTGRPPADALRWRSLALAEAAPPVGSRETFARGVERDGLACLLGNQDSGAQRVLGAAQLLVRLPAGSDPVAAGTRVAVLEL